MKKGITGFGTVANLIITLTFVVLMVMVYRYIIQTNAPEAFPIRYPFFNDTSVPVITTDIEEPTVLAIKKFNDLRVGNVDAMDLYKDRLKCSGPAVEGTVDSKKILLDPTHGGKLDRGIVVGEDIESELTRELALRISISGLAVTSTRDLNHDIAGDLLSVDERLAMVGENDVIISFGGSDGTELVAYVTDDISARVACEIINVILDSKAGELVSGFSVVPIDSKILPADDPKRILVDGKIAIYLEIGLGLYDRIETNIIKEGLKNAHE